MKCKQLNHVGIRTQNMEELTRFYAEVLGLRQHPDKTNWFKVGNSDSMVHLMPANGSADGNDLVDAARHICFEVESLEDVVTTLLKHDLKPFQTKVDAVTRRDLTDDSDLDFGIGTVFVADPEGNVVEFMEPARGIFEQVHF